MNRIARLGIAALLTVATFVLSADAAGKKKTKEPITYMVTAKELGEEFARRAKAAEKKYNPAPAKGGAARIDIDGVVKEVDNAMNTVALEGTPKVSVVLRTKKIVGEKEGKRYAVAKGGKFVEYNAKMKAIVIEFDTVKLEKAN